MAIASWLTPAAKSGTGNKTVGLTASKNAGASNNYCYCFSQRYYENY